jgi:hypothetical protein
MKETQNSLSGDPSGEPEGGTIEQRLFKVMAIAVVLAVSISALSAPWRVTTGLLLGGTLSLLNYRWLSSSIAAVIAAYAGGSGTGTGAKGSRYILRYVVIAALVIVAFKLNVVSLPATIIGLCSFVVAFFAEASRQFYFIIVHREGIN